jgi:CTP:molybdopterin cytidylyltransferase MocA
MEIPVTPAIHAVVLAGGASRRRGRPKQRVPAGERSLLARVTAEVCAAPVDGVAVVLGVAADDCARSLAGLPVTLLRNPLWAEGLASSIRAATRWAERTGASGLLLCVCDQVGVDAAHLTRLIATHHVTCRGLVASAYRGALGAPALFPRRLFPELGALTGDHGARDVIRSQRDVFAIDWPGGARDLDAVADLTAWRHGG